MNSEHSKWHPEVLPQDGHAALDTLISQPCMRRFYLAGGTALAMHCGHRISLDLDLFTVEHFQEDRILAELQAVLKLSVVAKGPETLHLHVAGTKVSLLGYHYPLIFPLHRYRNVPGADESEIAAMKLSAIASLGTCRDFVDAYVLSQRHELRELMRIFQQKYPDSNYNMVHLFKSLTYFADADKDAMPNMLIPLDWERVKQFFVQETPRLATYF